VPGLSVPILLVIVSAILFAPLASWLALQRARPWAVWFVFGVFLGPIASLLLVLAPPGRCPVCGNRSVGWPRSCSNCGLAFGSRLLPFATEGAEATAARARTASAEMALEAATPAMAASAASATSTAGSRATGLKPTGRASRTSRAGSGSSAITAVAGRGGDPVTGRTVPSQADGAGPVRRPATILGRRATAAPPTLLEPAPLPAPPSAPAMLGSGIFVAGGKSLQIGSRYLFARVGSELHILGPVHISPEKVAARLSLADIEPTIDADRLLVAPLKRGQGPELAFGGVILERGVVVDRDLRVATDRG
jgi:hypothetical protein